MGGDLLGAFEQAADDGDVVDLATVVDRDWRELYVFGPYTDKSEVERFVGFPTDQVDDDLGMQLGEHDTLLVFSDGEVVTTTVIHRSDVLLTPERERIDREDARFDVERVAVEDGVDLLRVRLVGDEADPAAD